MDFLIGLSGALVGGLLSFAGAVVVNRRVVTRAQRATLFLEVLPEVLPPLEAGRGTSADVQQMVERVQRHATVAGAADRKQVQRTDADVRTALAEQAEYTRVAASASRLAELRPPQLAEIEERRVEAVRRVGQTLAEYRTWLGGQLEHWL